MESIETSVSTQRLESRRACANCARAKAKCVIVESFIDTCQRCKRLNKLCEPNPVRSRTQPRKRKPLESTRIAKNRVEKLEEKLDDLVTLLKSGQENANGHVVHVSPLAGTSVPPLSNASLDYLPETIQEPSGDDSDYYQAESWNDRLHNGGTVYQRFGVPSDNSPFKIHNRKPEDLPPYQLEDIDIGTENPDALLSVFRDEMHPNFPFIVIPDSVLASELRRYRPTLYTAVMAIATRNSQQQRKIGQQFMRQVAERLIIRGERNLDLLLGILTYAGWCYFNFYNIPQITSLVSSATTLVADLKLNFQGDQNIPCTIVNTIRCSSGLEITKDKEKTLEDRRVSLGYWFLSSVTASFFRRLDNPCWTSYHEECCQILTASNDHPSDEIGIKLIRLQVFSDKIMSSPWHRKHEIARGIAPPILYLSSLQNELKDLKKTLSFDVEKNDAVILAFYSIEVLIHKIGLSKSPALSSFSNGDFNRLESLYACQQGLQRFFDFYLSIGVPKYHCFSVHIITLLTWNLGILQLLSTFDHPDWNPEWVKNSITFTGVLELLYERYSKAKEVLGFDPHKNAGEDIFSIISKKLLWLKSFFEVRHSGNSGGGESGSVEMQNDMVGEFPQGTEGIDLLDDQWMQDLLGPWDFNP